MLDGSVKQQASKTTSAMKHGSVAGAKTIDLILADMSSSHPKLVFLTVENNYLYDESIPRKLLTLQKLLM